MTICLREDGLWCNIKDVKILGWNPIEYDTLNVPADTDEEVQEYLDKE